MADTAAVEQVNGTDTVESQEQARTFTQEELDEIVKSRVAKERARYTDYDQLREKASRLDQIEEASKSDLQRATEKADALQKQLDAMNKANEVRQIREKVAKDTGVPAELLLGETEEECQAQANGILDYKNGAAKYPSVKDGGEPQNTTNKKSTADQFADWFNASLNS